MTNRTPISAQKNIWSDSQQVDDSDLLLEQSFNDTIASSMINNHIGTGILPEILVDNILFDSALASGFLDGKAIVAQNQPADNNFGNQLEIVLENSAAAGSRAVKIAIIGLDFQNNLQYETFYFKNNESQVGRKHFKKILTILFNDFLGSKDQSFNLGGHIIIREVRPLTLSRLPIMVAQDSQPNLFFRDFFLDGAASLSVFLQSALPLYNIDVLGIKTGELDSKVLSSGDVISQVGEKFIATTNNIQKVSLLLAIRNLTVGQETDLVWNGDLVISLYPLQSDISCATDIAPNLSIDFSPSNIPVAQISVNYTTLRDSGVVLDSVPQPVDFIFSNSLIASGNVLVPGTYYILSVKRSGAANKCDILLSTGTAVIPNSRISIFTGSLWVDLPEEQLWFKIWNDAAKISDGQAYEAGHGIIISKTTLDEVSQSLIDSSNEGFQFTGNGIFKAVISSTTEKSVPVPDQRTGNSILSRQQFTPSISLLNTIDIANLEKVSEPLILGAISDKNRKFFDSISSLINSNLHSSTIVGNEIIIKIITDDTDANRFDEDVISLESNLLNGDFEGAKIIPNSNNSNISYRISDAKICSMILGDVDGDGLVTDKDLVSLNSFVGYDLTIGLAKDTQFSSSGSTATFSNGYKFLTSPLVYPSSNQSAIPFKLINSITNQIALQGNDGILTVSPSDPTSANFTSPTINFNITGLSDYKLMIIAPASVEDYGAFNIVNRSSLNVLTIKKLLLTGNVFEQMLRADIDGDFHITSNDSYLLQQYVDRFTLNVSPVPPFPAPTTNAYANIGKKFNVIKLTLEKFIDRTDDYTANPIARASTVHPIPDVFINDNYFYSHDFSGSPAPITIEKKLTWNESLIVSNSFSKLVPAVFNNLDGGSPNLCVPFKNDCNIYASKPNFDPGTVDCFVPNNIILGESGELKRPNGEFYKVDFEIGTIVLEIPDGIFGSERTINIINDFISDYAGSGITRLGFPAMKFADCSFVTSDALSKDQLRFSVSVQSFSPNTSGLSTDGYSGAIVDGKMGVSIDYETGLLTLNFTNLFQDEVLKSLSTKVQINVFLKKGGFNNQPLFIDSRKMQNMLSLISVFSGANVGGISAIITGDDVQYAPATPGNWAGTPPTTIQEALDRLAAMTPGA